MAGMNSARKQIAIIGSGISGLGAAFTLYPHHDITVYEKNSYIGGHSRTVEVTTAHGMTPVDTGFIVFNYKNYPLLTKLFTHLNVPVAMSDMSFGASVRNGWLEYGTQRLWDMFAQPYNVLRPAYIRMVLDILRFNRRAHRFLDSPPSLSLGEVLDRMGMGEWFKQYFLLAMGGAIWSMPLRQMLEFPASTFIRFFDNHGLLTVNDQPQWYTVDGGSREYVKRLTTPFEDSIYINRGASAVIRHADHITVIDTRGKEDRYDEVVFACHADQALKLIHQPTSKEQAILAAFKYQPNRAVLHSDVSFMPKRKRAWASWVYLSRQVEDKSPHVSLSYWMNNLQPITAEQPLIVTLNPGHEPKPDLIHDDYWFDHPVFNEEAIRSQDRIASIQGVDRFWFCGAYQRYGFHEDGLLSAVTMAERMGVKPAWL